MSRFPVARTPARGAPPAQPLLRARRAPRYARRIALAAQLLAVLLLGGCIDFLEPNLPPASPAVLQLFIHMNSGQVQLEGSLQPGMSPAHEWRTVPQDSLLVVGTPVAPVTVHTNGARDYRTTLPLAQTGPVTVQAPPVAGIAGQPVDIRWYGLRRLDPDTVVLLPGADLRLHVDPVTPAQTPAPTGAQWYLQLFAGGHTFQLGADGLPPTELRVPPEFIPGDSTATVVNASLLILHGGSATAAGGDYVLNASFDQHINWIVVRRKGTTP